MKTKLERLQDALRYAQRYLSFLNKIGPRAIMGGGAVVWMLVSVAFYLLTPGMLSPVVYLLGGVLGWLVLVAMLTVMIWLVRTLTRGQIASLQEAIEKLEQEEWERAVQVQVGRTRTGEYHRWQNPSCQSERPRSSVTSRQRCPLSGLSG